ncbi:hypothetical protein ACFL6I_10250 [candidate division KSB1 bacterium]
MRTKHFFSRIGVCIACHQDLPDRDIFLNMISSAGNILNKTPHSDDEHMDLLNKDINWAARTRILIPIIAGLLSLIVFILVRKKIIVFNYRRRDK